MNRTRLHIARSFLVTALSTVMFACAAPPELADSSSDFIDRAFLAVAADTATLEIAGLAFRLGTPADSALAAIPVNIKAEYDLESNSYFVKQGPNFLGQLVLENGKVSAVRTVTEISRESLQALRATFVRKSGSSSCKTRLATGFDGESLFFWETCGLYSFVLPMRNRGNEASLVLQMPKS